jgi:hypothetical protein
MNSQKNLFRSVAEVFAYFSNAESLRVLRGLLFIAFLILPRLQLIAQSSGGTVNFCNKQSAKVLNGKTAGSVTSNDNVQAALYWAALGSTNFIQIGSTTTVGTPLDGLFAGGTRPTGPASLGGSTAQFQVRAWGGGYSTYEQALQNYGVLVGTSAIIQAPTGNPDGDPPTPPVSLTASGLQGFTLQPNLSQSPPVLACGSDKSVSCGVSWTFDLPTASDPCSGTNLTISIISTTTNGQCPQLVSRTWMATGSCNTNPAFCSQTVTIVDAEPPILSCASDKTVDCGTSWNFDSPTASDICSGTNVTIVVLGTLTNGICPQLVSRTWMATDLCGNTNSCTQTITVISSTPPIMSCASNKTVNCSTNWTFDLPAALDGCTGSNTAVALLNITTNSFCPLVMTSTWLATNACGISNTCSQTVLVLCADCPVIAVSKNCPAYPVPPGGIFTFSGTVTNLSDVTLTNVIVVNDQPAPNTVIFGPGMLAPGASASFTGSYGIAACSCGPHTDTLTARGTSPYGVRFTNFVTVTCPGTN